MGRPPLEGVNVAWALSERVQEIVGRALPGQIVKAGKWSQRYPLPDGVQSRLAAR